MIKDHVLFESGFDRAVITTTDSNHSFVLITDRNGLLTSFTYSVTWGAVLNRNDLASRVSSWQSALYYMLFLFAEKRLLDDEWYLDVIDAARRIMSTHEIDY